MDNFQMGKLIAVGCYGEVYKATDKTTGLGNRMLNELVGLPSAEEKLRLPDIQWEQFSDLEHARRPLTEFVPRLSPAGVDLLSQMLEIVLERRISALDALSHAFFGNLNLET